MARECGPHGQPRTVENLHSRTLPDWRIQSVPHSNRSPKDIRLGDSSFCRAIAEASTESSGTVVSLVANSPNSAIEFQKHNLLVRQLDWVPTRVVVWLCPENISFQMFQCGVCKSEYARSDHLLRHVRSHTRQRPFTCPVCAKGFSRQDLLKRHVGTHGKDSPAASSSGSYVLAYPGRENQRVHQACRSCAEKKLKCSEQKPCVRCTRKGLHCGFEPDPKPSDQQHARQLTTDACPSTDSTSGNDQTQRPDETEFEVGSSFQSNLQDANLETSFATNMHGTDMTASQDSFVQEVLYDTLDIPHLGNFIQQDHQLDLGDLDFSFLDPMNADNPRAAAPLVSHSPYFSVAPPPSTMGFGSEAFRKSNVHNGWEPGTDDHHRQEYPNLILPPISRSEYAQGLFHSSLATRKSMSPSMRDRILAMILRSSCSVATERITESFPPLDVLNDLIHRALAHMSQHQIIQFIHIPTFDLDEQRPEFLGSLIAYGCVYSPSQTVRRFGYALQEIIRAAVLRLVEEKHATLRDIGVCQAFYLQLYLACYSGVSRKIEMAECYSTLGATILRRGKMLAKEIYTTPKALLEIPGLSTHQKWLQWSQQETQKRLVYFAVALDAQFSITQRTKVLFSYAELKAPLPAHTTLWEAETADSWAENLQQNPQRRAQQPPSLSQILRQPQLLTAQKAIADMLSAASIFLAGFWSLVLEFQQISAILSSAQLSNDFVLSSRYSELSSNLDIFKIELANVEFYRPEVLIAQELISLHLNVSLYQLSDYAGIRAEEDAHAALAYIHQWFDSPKCRLALWHSGQIFRSTRLLERKKLADIHVLALYHATMTLWVWSLLRKAQEPSITTDGQTVVLDGEESPMMLKFLKSYPAVPSLTDESGNVVQLTNPVVAPDLANTILKANWDMEQMPRTSEEVSRMLNGFSDICRRKFAVSANERIS